MTTGELQSTILHQLFQRQTNLIAPGGRIHVQVILTLRKEGVRHARGNVPLWDTWLTKQNEEENFTLRRPANLLSAVCRPHLFLWVFRKMFRSTSSKIYGLTISL